MCVPRRVCSTRGVPRRPSPSVGTPARSPRSPRRTPRPPARPSRARVDVRAARVAELTERGADVGEGETEVDRGRVEAVLVRPSERPPARFARNPRGLPRSPRRRGAPRRPKEGTSKGHPQPRDSRRDRAPPRRSRSGGSRWDDGSGRRGRSSIRSGSAGEGGARQTRPLGTRHASRVVRPSGERVAPREDAEDADKLRRAITRTSVERTRKDHRERSYHGRGNDADIVRRASRSALARQPRPPQTPPEREMTNLPAKRRGMGGAQRATYFGARARPAATSDSSARTRLRHRQRLGGAARLFSRSHPAFATRIAFPSLTFLRPRPLDAPASPSSVSLLRPVTAAPGGVGTGGSVSRIFSRRGGFSRARLATFPRTREMSRRGLRRLGGTGSGADPGVDPGT